MDSRVKRLVWIGAKTERIYNPSQIPLTKSAYDHEPCNLNETSSNTKMCIKTQLVRVSSRKGNYIFYRLIAVV